MAVGAPDDVYRSLRRYVALMLGSPPWKVRLQRTRVSDDERPVAVLDPQPLTTPRSRAGTLNQGDVERAQTVTVVCYPVLGANAPESSQVARELASRLDAGFGRGLVSDDVPPVMIGAPWRVPVYDFAGVPIDGASRAGPSDPYMHADVGAGFNVRVQQDALDELRYTVIATVSLSWWAAGRIPPSGPLVTGITPEWLPERP